MTDSVLVLGAGGFIGKHLVRALGERGDEVIAVSRRTGESSTSRIEHVSAELRSPEDFLPYLDRSRTVVHLASASTPGSSAGQPLLELEQNLRPTLALLQALQQRPHCRLLYLSSAGSLYGDSGGAPAGEHDDVRPRSFHGAAKVAAEQFIGACCSQFPLSATVLRPSNVYGPGQGERAGFGIIPAAFGKILRQETLTIWGDGSAIRDYLYVDDFVALCLAILDAPMPPGRQILNASSGVGVRLDDLLERIEAVSGRSLPRTFAPGRAVDAGRVVIDSTQAQRAYGWTPATGLTEGLRRTWQWLSTTPR